MSAKKTIEEVRASNRARVARWKALNPERYAEKCRQASSKWARAHLESDRYHASPKIRGQIRVNAARWAAKNQDKVLACAVANQQNRRVLKGSGRVTTQEWSQVKELFGHRCGYCGCSRKRLSMDHVTPLSRDGAHHVGNIVPACVSCNSRKHARGPLSMVNVVYQQESL